MVLARREKAGGGGSAASGRPAAALSATEAMGMTDRVKEHQWDEAKLLVGFNRAMWGSRTAVHGELRARVAMLGGDAVGTRGALAGPFIGGQGERRSG